LFALNIRFLEEIGRERDAAIHQLDTLQPPWRTGFYPRIEFLRLSLHKSITSRVTDHRREQLKYWEDAVNLNKERRKFLDEYKALIGMRGRLSVDEDRCRGTGTIVAAMIVLRRRWPGDGWSGFGSPQRGDGLHPRVERRCLGRRGTRGTPTLDIPGITTRLVHGTLTWWP
jgi:hypothetical protein